MVRQNITEARRELEKTLRGLLKQKKYQVLSLQDFMTIIGKVLKKERGS